MCSNPPHTAASRPAPLAPKPSACTPGLCSAPLSPGSGSPWAGQAVSVDNDPPVHPNISGGMARRQPCSKRRHPGHPTFTIAHLLPKPPSQLMEADGQTPAAPPPAVRAGAGDSETPPQLLLQVGACQTGRHWAAPALPQLHCRWRPLRRLQSGSFFCYQLFIQILGFLRQALSKYGILKLQPNGGMLAKRKKRCVKN